MLCSREVSEDLRGDVGTALILDFVGVFVARANAPLMLEGC